MPATLLLLVAGVRADDVGSLSGRVLGPDGAGVGSIPLSIISSDSKKSTMSESAADGTYVVTGLLAGLYIVQASGNDQNFLARKRVRIEGGLETRNVDLRSGGLVLTGLATDSSGHGVEGAFVTVHKTDFDAGEFLPTASARTAHTDAQGRYRIDGLLPGRYAMTIAGPARGILDFTNVVVEADATQDVVFEDACHISGHVVGPGGESAADAQIQVYRVAPAPMIRCFAMSDDEGRFLVEHLGPGRYEVIAMGSGYEPAVKTGVEAVAGATNDVGDLELRKGGGTLTGRVTYGPLPLPVVITMKSATTSLEYMTQADEQGEYTIENIPAGTYAINFSDPTSEPLPVSIQEGEKTVLDFSYYSAN